MDISDLLYKEVKIPGLDDVGYGETIADNFKTINENFKRLSQLDFVKGDDGETMFVETIDLSSDTMFNSMIKTAIREYHNNKGTQNIDNSSNTLFYHLDNKSNPSVIHMIYKINPSKTDSTKTYVSSLPYVFLDGRFNRSTLSTDVSNNSSSYTSAIDHSCVIIWDDNSKGFKAVDSFPTLYYDPEIGLCWMINGEQSGISAQGPEGRSGKDGYLFLTKAKKASTTTEPDRYLIVQVFDNDSSTWVEPSHSVALNKHDSTIAIVTSTPEDATKESTKMWITSIVKESSSGYYYAICNEESQLSTIIDAGTIIDIFNSINVNNNSLPGLYIPTDGGYHIAYSTGNDLYIKPVQKKETPDTATPIVGSDMNIEYQKTFCKTLVSGGFSSETHTIDRSKDEKDGAMTIMTHMTIDSPINSNDGVKELFNILYKTGVLDINTITNTVLSDDEYNPKVEAEIPTATIHTPQGSIFIIKSKTQNAYSSGNSTNNNSRYTNRYNFNIHMDYYGYLNIKDYIKSIDITPFVRYSLTSPISLVIDVLNENDNNTIVNGEIIMYLDNETEASAENACSHNVSIIDPSPWFVDKKYSIIMNKYYSSNIKDLITQ